MDSRDKMMLKALELEEENKRLRSALQAIADLQRDEPRQPTGYEPDVYYHEDKGRYEAAEMARKALVKP